MSLENCQRCGSLFLREKSEFCADCTRWYAEVYGKVRAYLREKPNSNLWDLHVALEIPLSVLQQVVKGEKLH
ncbi:hypothetical protein [Paenibacillus alkalitolerans]|uniref:hypothetical protein n=1 Tax=Paenibacillus alkalitolerans TaxID=2799335 RepID=UPI0018F5F731|nr:hypothetical protein [Paenibacillus alkalitolerans]